MTRGDGSVGITKMSPASVTSLDGFHATRSAQRADELVRAYLDAVNAEA